MEKEDEGSGGAIYIGTNIEKQENNNCIQCFDGSSPTFHIHFDADKQKDFMQSVKGDQTSSLPKELESNRAKGMLRELVKERLLKDDWQPADGVAEWQLAVIAHKLGEELEIQSFWQVFARLWNRKAENLRGNYNMYLNKEVEIKFRKILSKIA